MRKQVLSTSTQDTKRNKGAKREKEKKKNGGEKKLLMTEIKSQMAVSSIMQKMKLEISYFQSLCYCFSAGVLVTFSHFPSTCSVEVCVCVCVYMCFPNESVKVVTHFLQPSFWSFLWVFSEPHVSEVGGADA